MPLLARAGCARRNPAGNRVAWIWRAVGYRRIVRLWA
jgi:hypothetical protein